MQHPSQMKKGFVCAAVVAIAAASPGIPETIQHTVDQVSQHRTSEREPMPVSKYKNLLDTIAKGESRGNYNAYFGHADNQEIDFTTMTVAEVIEWQKDYVASGSQSSAVGKYQIIRRTMESLIRKENIDTSQKFDKAMQDRMAIALLEKRGLRDFIQGRIDRDTFINNLSKEWAALPRASGPNRGKSHYQGDGLNKVQISLSDIYASVDLLRS